MTGGSIIDTALHHGMTVGTKKQSCAEDFIAQKKLKLLINSNQVIFTGCYSFYSHLCNQDAFMYKPSELPLCKRSMEILAL